MSIRRTELPFEGKFTQIPNAWVRDKRLSRRARGLLVELMSHRVGWKISFQDLQAAGTEGREALQSAIRELKTYGYLRIEQERREDGTNTFGEVHYIVSEPDAEPVDGFPVDRLSRSTAFPLSGKPTTKKTSSSEDYEEQEDEGGATLFEAEDVPSGTRAAMALPRPFSVTTKMREWALSHAPSVAVDAVTVEFVTYWREGEGKGKRKKNWALTWMKWLVREHESNVARGWRSPESQPAKKVYRNGRVVA